MKTVNDSSFEMDVLKASEQHPVVVNFSASWCGPCKAMKPQIEALEGSMTSATFVHCDVDDAPNATNKFGIMGVPTYIVINNHKEELRITGSGPMVVDGIKKAIENIQPA